MVNQNVPLLDKTPSFADFDRFNQIDRQTRLLYLMELLAELRNQALSLNEKTLAYLIEMSVLEAVQLREIEEFQRKLPAD